MWRHGFFVLRDVHSQRVYLQEESLPWFLSVYQLKIKYDQDKFRAVFSCIRHDKKGGKRGDGERYVTPARAAAKESTETSPAMSAIITRFLRNQGVSIWGTGARQQ